jgi:superfamily I DNA/RNA helicase
VTTLSDAANEFEGDRSAFPAAFRAGELGEEEWLPASALPADAVALLTVHQAKGLEWEAVFVAELVLPLPIPRERGYAHPASVRG